MTILIFIVMLVVLIVGHEFGHLIAAKLSGMKVPEFGIGFPPKLWSKKIGDTEYSINALPFGGFVKITGEDANEALADPAAFANRPKVLQAATLIAGPFANWLMALVCVVVAFMIGVPTVLEPDGHYEHVSESKVIITEVLQGSPAEDGGLKTGDRVFSITVGDRKTIVHKPEDISAALASDEGEALLVVGRGEETITLSALPKTGIIEEAPERPALGIASALIGVVRLPVLEAITEGVKETVAMTAAVFLGLIGLIASAATLSADVSNLAGPVGIASMTGDAVGFGLGSFLSFVALISVNLAILNLLPFPALDGGRLVFLAIETVTRRSIPTSVANATNTVGFGILILLMLAVTANDIFRLFS